MAAMPQGGSLHPSPPNPQRGVPLYPASLSTEPTGGGPLHPASLSPLTLPFPIASTPPGTPRAG